MSQIPKVGEIFESKYEIQQILGSGGNGTVARALQLDCQRIVAIKILHSEIAFDEEFKARFLREAQTLHKLSHVNIVTFYHIGISSIGLPYLVMEYINGKSIRALCNETPELPLRRSLTIVRGAALALAYVHENGIVHRDIKPENLIITDEPEPDTVKLVDFGLARLIESEEQRLTGTGQVLGSSNYMSPEQCLGQPADLRSDIYSLTACLFEMICGKPPFEADTAIGLMYKHINEEPPKFSTTKFAGAVELNNIIRIGMAKDPKARFANMSEMAHCIDKLNSCSMAERKPFVLRRSTFAISVVLILLLLLAGSIGLRRNYLSSEKAQSTEHDKRNENSSSRVLRMLETYQAQLRTMEKSKGPDSYALAPILSTLGENFTTLRRFPEAEKCFRRALTLSLKNNPTDLALEVKRSHDLASNLMLQLKFAEATALYARILAIRKQCGGDTEDSLTELAEGYLDLQKPAEAEKYLKQVLDLRKKEFGENSPEISDALINLGRSYCAQNHFKEAIDLEQRALELDEIADSNSSGNQDTVRAVATQGEYQRLGRALSELGHTCLSANQLDKAAYYYQRAIGLDEKWRSESDQGFPVDLEEYAHVLVCLRQYDKAEPILNRALSLEERYDNVRLDTLRYSAICCQFLKKDKEGKIILSKALDKIDHQIGNGRISTLADLLALCPEMSANRMRAEKMLAAILDQLLADRKGSNYASSSKGTIDYGIVTAWDNLADAYQHDGAYDKSERCRQISLELLQSAPDRASVARHLQELAYCLMKQKKLESAKSNLQQAQSICKDLPPSVRALPAIQHLETTIHQQLDQCR